MKVVFVIDSPLIRLRVKTDWGFLHLPRVGEMISPRILKLQIDFSYRKFSQYMTDEAREDFKKYSNSENDIEACFREWLYDVISGINVVESILYCPDPENDENIIPEIRLSD